MHPRPSIYVSVLVAAAFFMENLDGTIIATALPQMARSFHVDAVHLNIGITAYLLTLGVFVPVSGWVADRVGARTVFATAIATFTFASLFCALSQSLVGFTAMRILQGIGGSMMVPVGRLIVVRASPKEKLTEAIAWITWPALTALVLGPALGGFITTAFSWRWIFVLNLPLGILAFILALILIDDSRSDERHPFDWRTFLPAGIATTCIVYAFELLGRGEETHRAVGLLVVSVIAGVIALIAARTHPDTSLIDFSSLRRKSYSISVFGGSSFRIAISVLPFLLPLMFQLAMGMDALHAGGLLLALFAGDLSMKAIVIPILRRYGFRNVLIVNGIITAVSIALCATIDNSTPTALICGLLFFHGASRSLEFTAMTTLAYTEIPAANMARANSLLSALMQLMIGMGVACGAVILRAIVHARGHATSTPSIGDFHLAILLMVLPALGPTIDSFGLAPNAGAATSRHRRYWTQITV